MRLRLPALCLVLAAACGGSDAPADADANALTVRVDTIGDTLVVRTDGDIPADQELRVVEEWRVGDADDPTIGFGRVGQLAVADDGHVFVFDPTGPDLREYASDGAFVRRYGGKGGGPGEYERSNGVAVLSDGRIALWDAGGARINFYDRSGAYLGLARAPVSGFNTTGNSLFADSNGGFWVAGFILDSLSERSVLGRRAWYHYVDDALRDTVREPGGRPEPPRLLASVEGNTSSISVPYYPTPGFLFHPDGRLSEYVGEPYVVHTWAGERPLRIVRTVTRVPIPAEERAERRAFAEWSMRQTQPDWRWNGPEIPSGKAPVRGLARGDDGALLVEVPTASERYDPDPPLGASENPPPLVHFRAATAFERFSPDGRFAGRFTLPFDASIRAMRGDRIWFAGTDELGVPYLAQARLVPPSD